MARTDPAAPAEVKITRLSVCSQCWQAWAPGEPECQCGPAAIVVELVRRHNSIGAHHSRRDVEDVNVGDYL